MDPYRFRFRSVWDLPAPPGIVRAVLGRPDQYPSWWPQVREATRLDAHSGTARIRSFLPLDLTVTVTEVPRDPGAGVLESALGGDIEGWARWTLTSPAQGRTRARYDQQVVVRRPLLRRLALPGRPLFTANHAWMMRAGRRGLVAYLDTV
ncbi:SRPBCC family protein [Streptomyces sp. NPDC015131]|uniref:SRPBCC family protein n=1 Tax=Streptomyces sp. NPDC015131 TaxID=3364941 RepID=UPI0036FFC098